MHQVEALDSPPPHVKEPLVAFVVTTVAFTLDSLMFTVALTELSTRHLASGTARPSGPILPEAMPSLQGLSSRATLPSWTEWVALLVGG